MRVGANAELAIIRNDFVIGLHEFVMSAPMDRRSTACVRWWLQG